MKTKRLKESKRELENKVKERTIELSKEHQKLEQAYFEIDEESHRLIILAITASWQYTRYMKL